MKLPIALTCGDPNGIGIDLSFEAKAILKNKIPFFLIADINHLKNRNCHQKFRKIINPNDCLKLDDNILPVLHHKFPEIPTLNGSQSGNALAIIEVIERAVKIFENGDISAICTNPINKKVLKDGCDFEYPGHTEFLAKLAKLDKSVMMLICDELRVVPVTIHVALNEVSKLLTEKLIIETVRTTHNSLINDFGIVKPRVAISGLNPHAGENGTFGDEEIHIIQPAVQILKNEGLNIIGPLSADTMFHSAARKQYDVAICMYHDQALIPIKTIDFYGGVNMTLGLPFIRTSPDHGTAFELAGTRKANPMSLINALELAHNTANERL
ncbi:4-hydroxythreonine-4-phosphate dehydrogenase PdxA [Amylibacter sp.]|nr:4-hydroxythreonine-4-phosphate dehydrogenase PdxA [Amylibacter sp.]